MSVWVLPADRRMVLFAELVNRFPEELMLMQFKNVLAFAVDPIAIEQLPVAFAEPPMTTVDAPPLVEPPPIATPESPEQFAFKPNATAAFPAQFEFFPMATDPPLEAADAVAPHPIAMALTPLAVVPIPSATDVDPVAAAPFPIDTDLAPTVADALASRSVVADVVMSPATIWPVNVVEVPATAALTFVRLR